MNMSRATKIYKEVRKVKIKVQGVATLRSRLSLEIDLCKMKLQILIFCTNYRKTLVYREEFCIVTLRLIDKCNSFKRKENKPE